jgi:hypothetical protein
VSGMSLTAKALAKLDDEKLEQLTLRATELSTLMGKVNEALEREQTLSPAPPPPPPPPARRDKLSQSLPMDADRPGFSQSLPTHPAAKKVLVDKYAEIALFDADQNQQEILRSGALEMQKKTAMKKVLDEQVRVKQAIVLKERAQDREWLHREQARVLIWNEEEKKKIAEERSKYAEIRLQREQQLREAAALRKRDDDEMLQYEVGILRDIHTELQREKAVEAAKKARDAKALKDLALQNIENIKLMKIKKAEEFRAMRALEAQWSGVLDKQERQRTRQLALTYSRQAKQYAASESMQAIMNKQGQADEERALARQLADERAAKEKIAAQKAHRAQLQHDCLDVLAIQVRDKQVRAHADVKRDSAVIEREKIDLIKAEIADSKFRETKRLESIAYAHELQEQRRIQETRKTLEPFLMSRPERQMNAEMIGRLPSY